MIEWINARLAPDTVGPEKSSHLFDRHRYDGRVNRPHAEALGGVYLNSKIVPARTEPGKVHERLDAIVAQGREWILCAVHRHMDELWRYLRPQPGPKIPPPHRNVWHPALDRRRPDLDRDVRALRLDQPDRGVHHAD